MSSASVVQALTVLEFLVKRGSDQCVENSKVLLPKLEDLQVFEYTSPDGQAELKGLIRDVRPRRHFCIHSRHFRLCGLSL